METLKPDKSEGPKVETPKPEKSEDPKVETPKIPTPELQKRETEDNNIVIEYKRTPRHLMNKLAIFDVDWTLIKPKEGRTFPKNKDDWIWLRESVPETVRNYHKDGYNIVFLTDQSKPWKVSMIENVIQEIDVPITCLIAMNKTFHKPNPAFFMKNFADTFLPHSSFYVGDAAGREGDWSRNDIEVASRIGVQFYTPEEVFPLGAKMETPKKSLPEESEGPKLETPEGPEGPKVIIMVGYPASGKTTLAKELEKQGNYLRIDGDSLKTGQRMVKEAEKHVSTKKSIIFDATNGTKERRRIYIDFAKKHGLPVQCIWKTTSIEMSMEQNRERQRKGGPKVPDIAYYTYRKKFEAPTNDECVITKVL